MSDSTVIHLALSAMLVGLKLCAPILLTALFIGFGVSLFQSVTQIQEVTLSFVPKAVGVGIAILLCGNWMMHELVSFTVQLYTSMPTILQTGEPDERRCPHPGPARPAAGLRPCGRLADHRAAVLLEGGAGPDQGAA